MKTVVDRQMCIHIRQIVLKFESSSVNGMAMIVRKHTKKNILPVQNLVIPIKSPKGILHFFAMIDV